MIRAARAAFLIGLAGCGGDRHPVGGLDVEVRVGAGAPSGALEQCVLLTVTEEPLYLDRVAFVADEARVAPREREWTDVTVSSSLELCLSVCACEPGEIGELVVEDDGERTTRDVIWPEGRCCEVPADGGAP